MILSSSEMMYRLDMLNEQQRKLSYQSSTGRVLQNGSDDASLFARDIYVDDKILNYEGIKVQIDKSKVANTSSDSTMGELKKLMEFVKKELIKASTDTTDDKGREAIAIGLKGIKENMFRFANEEVNGQYLFSGLDASVKPFEMDSNGKVTYEGDSQLKRIAVEEGTYRPRGVNGFEMMMFPTDVATRGDSNLSFKESDRIIDQDGNEWKLNAAKTAIVKHDLDGNATTDTKAVISSVGTPTVHTVDVGNADGTRFEAKKSIFDVLDEAINALEKKDSAGNPISSDEAKDKLKTAQSEIDKSYDSMNAAHANLGSRNKIFDISLERVTAKISQFNILSQEIGSIDFAEVAVKTKALELTYTSLYSTINRVNELSLTNFLR